MPQLHLFDDDRPEFAGLLGPRLRSLAEQGVYLGTSSWKYEGWLGQIYSPSRYSTRGKFSQARFQAECLTEYAETFPIVCGDFSFYQFPTATYWRRLFNETPESFLFAFKVPEEITVPVWPNHPRYGPRAGSENRGFLDPHLFNVAFSKELAPYRDRVACLIFEFGTFPKKVFREPSWFFERLADFLAGISDEHRAAIEIRNPEYLGPSYFDVLERHKTAHVFNAWTRMPELADQIAMPGAFTTDFTVARALLRRGKSYEQAVTDFQPYKLIQEPNIPIRQALKSLVNRGKLTRDPTFLFINNRLEGNSPGTIQAVTEPDS